MVSFLSRVTFVGMAWHNAVPHGHGTFGPVIRPRAKVLDPVNSRPDYDYIYEEARQKWLSIIRGIARPIRYDVNPVNLVIETAWFVASSDIIGGTPRATTLSLVRDGAKAFSFRTYWILWILGPSGAQNHPNP